MPSDRARPRGRPHGALDRPCSCGHGNRAVGGGNQAHLQGVPYPVSRLDGQRSKVGGRSALPTQKRPPVIVEIAKDRGDIDRAYRHRDLAGAPEQLLPRLRLTEGETLGLVEFRITAVQFDRHIPGLKTNWSQAESRRADQYTAIAICTAKAENLRVTAKADNELRWMVD